MADERAEVKIKQFAGMVSNADPHDLDPGMMQVQVNLLARRPGELSSRGGLREMTSDTE